MKKTPKLRARISPTNLGFLLNARQVACEFGYLTVPEFAQQTLRTLATVSQLQRHRGHLLNWYDTQTLAPLIPAFVSSVDSGNLWLRCGRCSGDAWNCSTSRCSSANCRMDFLDHLYVLTQPAGPAPPQVLGDEEGAEAAGLACSIFWIFPMRRSRTSISRLRARNRPTRPDGSRRQAEERIRQVCRAVQVYAPWLLPEFAALKNDPAIHPPGPARRNSRTEADAAVHR